MELRFNVPEVGGKIDTTFLRCFCDLVDGMDSTGTKENAVEKPAKGRKGASVALPLPDTTKRKRRTKAEIEAERLALEEAEEDEEEELEEEEDTEEEELEEEEDTEEEEEEEEEAPKKTKAKTTTKAKPTSAKKASQADVVQAFQKYAKKHGRDEARDVLRKKFKVAHIRELDAAQYNSVIKYLER